MKKFFLTLFFATQAVFSINCGMQDLVDSIALPYEKALLFFEGTQSKKEIDVHQFFSKHSLSNKREIAQLKKSAIKVGRLAKKNKQKEWKNLSLRLHSLFNFVEENKGIYYSSLIFEEIENYYSLIDENSHDIVSLVNKHPEVFNIANKKDVFYRLVKKINLDLRRLEHLFVRYEIKNDFGVKINHLKDKLFLLKQKITSTSLYKYEQFKMGALGFLKSSLYFLLIMGAGPLFILAAILFDSLYVGASFGICFASLLILSPFFLVIGKEFYEAYKYDIPLKRDFMFPFLPR